MHKAGQSIYPQAEFIGHHFTNSFKYRIMETESFRARGASKG